MHKAELGTLVEAFFCKRLISQRRASPHTIASYRDTFRLLLHTRPIGLSVKARKKMVGMAL